MRPQLTTGKDHTGPRHPGKLREAMGALAARGAEMPEGGTVTATPLPWEVTCCQTPGSNPHRHMCTQTRMRDTTRSHAHCVHTQHVGGGLASLPAREESYVSPP